MIGPLSVSEYYTEYYKRARAARELVRIVIKLKLYGDKRLLFSNDVYDFAKAHYGRTVIEDT